MDFNVSEEKRNKVREVFMSMKPDGLLEEESCKLAKDWLKANEHDGKFTLDFLDLSFTSDVTYTVINPCNKEKLTEIFLATEWCLQNAIELAKKQFETWAATDGLKRAELLLNVAQNIENQKQLFALLESITTGKPIRRVRSQDLPLLIQSFYHFAGWAASSGEKIHDWSPLGIVYVISSGCNYPLMSLCWHVASALAVGNTVMLEVDASTCLSALFLAHIMKKSGVPNGVFSVLPQQSPLLCKLNETKLEDLSKIFFSGSFQDAQKLRQCNLLKHIEMEIHSATQPTAVIVEGADIDSTVAGVLDLFYFNDVRSQSAGCRVLIQDSIKNRFVEKLVAKFKKTRIGSCLTNADIIAVEDPNKSSTTVEEITKVYNGDVCVLDNPKEGVVDPCIIHNLQTSSPFVHEQVHGPFLILVSFRTVKEVITIINHEKSGCDVSIWSEKLPTALHIAHCLKTANIWINCQNVFDSSASYGSVYKSGNMNTGGHMGIFHFMKPSLKKKTLEENANKTSQNESCKLDFWQESFKLYYGGTFKNADSGTSRTVQNSKGCEIGQVPDGSRKDIRNAVELAVVAQPKWSAQNAINRGKILYCVARSLKASEKEFYVMLHAITQRPLEDCMHEVQISIKQLFYWAAMCDKYSGTVKETQMYGKVLESLEPLGVIGIICPDEYPLVSFVSLVCPVIAKGNAVVVVPSEKYPFAALKLCQVFHTCSLPGGVLSVITGSSSALTKVLAGHMEVDGIWMHRACLECAAFVRDSSTMNQKRIWIDVNHDWLSCCEGLEFLLRSTYTKTIWLPMGDVFAN